MTVVQLSYNFILLSMQKLSRQLKVAERSQRMAFREKYDHHFILSLFPSFSDRLRTQEFAVSSIIPISIHLYIYNIIIIIIITCPEIVDIDA